MTALRRAQIPEKRVTDLEAQERHLQCHLRPSKAGPTWAVAKTGLTLFRQLEHRQAMTYHAPRTSEVGETAWRWRESTSSTNWPCTWATGMFARQASWEQGDFPPHNFLLAVSFYGSILCSIKLIEPACQAWDISLAALRRERGGRSGQQAKCV